jgi:hypothetical protein
VNVRDLILKGKTIGELHGILFKMGVSKGTAQSYIDEAVSDIKKKMKK